MTCCCSSSSTYYSVSGGGGGSGGGGSGSGSGSGSGGGGNISCGCQCCPLSANLHVMISGSVADGTYPISYNATSNAWQLVVNGGAYTQANCCNVSGNLCLNIFCVNAGGLTTWNISMGFLATDQGVVSSCNPLAIDFTLYNTSPNGCAYGSNTIVVTLMP